jgi:hypothetical protein
MSVAGWLRHLTTELFLLGRILRIVGRYVKQIKCKVSTRWGGGRKRKGEKNERRTQITEERLTEGRKKGRKEGLKEIYKFPKKQTKERLKH